MDRRTDTFSSNAALENVMRPQNTVTCVYRFFLYDVTAYDITQCLDFYLVKFIIIIFLIN